MLALLYHVLQHTPELQESSNKFRSIPLWRVAILFPSHSYWNCLSPPKASSRNSMNALFSWNAHISKDIWEFDLFKIIFCLQFLPFHRIYEFKHSYLPSHQNNEICDYDDFLDNLLIIHHGRTKVILYVIPPIAGFTSFALFSDWILLNFPWFLLQTLPMIYALAYNTIIPSHSLTITTHI